MHQTFGLASMEQAAMQASRGDDHNNKLGVSTIHLPASSCCISCRSSNMTTHQGDRGSSKLLEKGCPSIRTARCVPIEASLIASIIDSI